MRSVLLQRQTLKNAVRRFFNEREYLEVETPVLVPQPGVEVHTDYFTTTWHDHRGKPRKFFLRSSPELAMKRLLTHDLCRIYQMGPCFRTGGEFTAWHQPEFSLLEWYRVGAGYDEFIHETEMLCRFAEQAMIETHALSPILPSRLTKITVANAFHTFAGIKLIDLDPDLGRKGQERGFASLNPTDDFETAFFKIMLDIIEPELKKLGFVCLFDYPASQAVLANVQDDVANRFEFYLHGVELCNAFQECTIPSENSARLNTTNQARLSLGKPALPRDEAFFADLDRGMPACCGNALGLDRFLCLLLGKDNLDFVLPLWRSQYQQDLRE